MTDRPFVTYRFAPPPALSLVEAIDFDAVPRSTGEMANKRSDDHYVDVPDGISTDEMMDLVERAAISSGLYISHIGGYSKKKFPNSVHWHFKRNPKEPGLLDATFWDVKSLFWLMIRHNEPAWVHNHVPELLKALRSEVELLRS